MNKVFLAGMATLALGAAAPVAMAQDSTFSFAFDSRDFGTVGIFDQGDDLLVKYTAPIDAVPGDNPRTTGFGLEIPGFGNFDFSALNPDDGDFTDDLDDLDFEEDTNGFPQPSFGQGSITSNFDVSGAGPGTPGVPLTGGGLMDRFSVSSGDGPLDASNVTGVGARIQGIEVDDPEGGDNVTSLFLVGDEEEATPNGNGIM